jgi:asparagine synthase (glutamine-hydrolysing)
MCGIAGFISSDGAPPAPGMLDIFARALAHRGPDGGGQYSANAVSLLQTRLAIIDLETGNQPLYGPSETALVANGEIYNYLTLRASFQEGVFRTQSDCEVPLFIYAKEGGAFAKSLRGMFAIALQDAPQDKLFLSRDPFGIKPLYYVETASGMGFASEPAALLRAGLGKRNVRTDAATELLQLQFTTGAQTIFEGISRVLPGETLEISRGRVATRSAIAALPAGPPLNIGEDEALALLDTALMDSVSVHQISDVPYGMFLSGGVDSSVVLACMARLNERPVRAFTAGFPGTEARDEREHAGRVAKAAGAEHVEIAVTEEDFWNHLPAIAGVMDDPVADYAIVPTYLLAREAAKHVKVVLSGEGGDELFAGYGRYRTALRPRLLGGRKMRRHGVLDGLGLLREENANWRSGISAAELSTEGKSWSKLQRAQASDIAEWLPNDLLVKLDRCLMAHGIEGRTPFLDPVVASLVFRFPDRLKISRGQGKYLLRRWLQNALPAAEPFSKKRGFTVPAAEWISGRARTLAPLVARDEGVSQLCRPDAVAHLFETIARGADKRAGAACWNLLFYALWHRIHIGDKRPIGDVIAFLEETA